MGVAALIANKDEATEIMLLGTELPGKRGNTATQAKFRSYTPIVVRI
jgi:hypothetical protein